MVSINCVMQSIFKALQSIFACGLIQKEQFLYKTNTKNNALEIHEGQ